MSPSPARPRRARVAKPCRRAILAALAPLALGGCSVGPPSTDRALVIDAFDVDGRTTTEPDSIGPVEPGRPVVMRFEPGDEIDLRFDVDAPAYLEPVDEHTLRVVRPMDLFIDGRGAYVAEPGGELRRLHGSVGVGLALDEATRRNRAVVSLEVPDPPSGE